MIFDKELQCAEEAIAAFDLKPFEGKKIFITGATGLIGKTLVRALVKGTDSAVVTALVRDEKRAQGIFEDCLCDRLIFKVADMAGFEPYDGGFDYVVHGASNTSSKAFVEKPTEIIMGTVNSAFKMLEHSHLNNAKMVFLSTMETYGCPPDDRKIDENSPSFLDSMSPRSCYPESKRLCENLCASYMKEKGTEICTIRLTQTFGPGVGYDDGRVFAEFARCAIENRNIVLKTLGQTKRNYLYVPDAVTAILRVLLSGVPGEAYNAANEDTYCSIKEMAESVTKINDKIKVEICVDDPGKNGYAPTLCMNLDTRKLQALGWKPTKGMREMFEMLIEDMKDKKAAMDRQV